MVIYPHPVDCYHSYSLSDPIFGICYIYRGKNRLISDSCLCIVHTFPGFSNNVNYMDPRFLQQYAFCLYSIYVFIVVTDVFNIFIFHSPIFLQHTPVRSCNATLFLTIWFCLPDADFSVPTSYTFL